MSVTKPTTRKGKTSKTSELATEAVLTEGAKIVATTTEVTVDPFQVMVEARKATGVSVPPVAPTAATGQPDQPNAELARLEKVISEAVAVIVGFEESAASVSTTHAYWNLGKAIPEYFNARSWKKGEKFSAWLESKRINPTRKSRAKSIHQHLSEAESKELTIPRALALMNARKHSKEVAARAALPNADKLISKLASVQAAIGALKQLANELSAADLLATEKVLSAAVAEFNDLKADLEKKIGHKITPLKKKPEPKADEKAA